VRDMQRWIVHVDMDAFYAAIEQHDHPEFAGKPVIVGGLSSRGVVATASYEARRFGVRSAMPMTEARRRCPEGIFLSGNHDRYREVSKQIMTVLADFSPLVEPLSLDEAFLDVSGMERLYPDLTSLAQNIKTRIRKEVGLTASVGVAANKFLAKLASDLNKPDGLLLIEPDQAKALLAPMTVTKVWGVGAATMQVLQQLGITTIGELAEADLALLVKHCGNSAYTLQALANGQDDRPVIPEKPPQSVGKELTFMADLYAADEIQAQLLSLAEKVGWRLRCLGYSGRTITLKVRYGSFKTITRSRTIADSTNFDEVIYQIAGELFKACNSKEGIRLLGITVSNLQLGDQLALFDEDDKRRALYQTLDNLKARFGEDIITKAQLIR
jgi:DNA polymerase-4